MIASLALSCETSAVIKRLPTQRDRSAGRAVSQGDGTPRDEIDEITDRLEMLEASPQPAPPPMSARDLSMVMASFEAKLCELNKSLTKEARANRQTIRNFSSELEKTKESVEDLNTELNLVIRREVG